MPGPMQPTIPQVVVSPSNTPITGKPYNFNRLLRGVFIPLQLVSYRKIPPGARMLWGLIRAASHHDGTCTRSKARLGYVMGVTRRSMMNYLAALTKEGFLETHERPGRTPIRVLLWHPVFEISTAKGGKKLPPGGQEVAPGGAESCPHSKSSVESSVESVGRQVLPKELQGQKREGKMAKASDVLGKLPAALTDPTGRKGKAKGPAVGLASQLAENEAILREVQACGFPLTENLKEQLARKMRAYGRNGFQVAAAISRALRKVSAKATFKPDSDRWILAVVENDFAANGKLKGRVAE